VVAGILQCPTVGRLRFVVAPQEPLSDAYPRQGRRGCANSLADTCAGTGTKTVAGGARLGWRNPGRGDHGQAECKKPNVQGRNWSASGLSPNLEQPGIGSADLPGQPIE